MSSDYMRRVTELLGGVPPTADELRTLIATIESENDVARRIAKAMIEHFPLNDHARSWANWIDSGEWRKEPPPECLGCKLSVCPIHAPNAAAPEQT